MPRWGHKLKFFSTREWVDVLSRSINRFCHENGPINIVLAPEVLLIGAQLDRALTSPGGSVLLIGEPGSGRRSMSMIIASIHQMRLCTPRITKDYGIKNFRLDLKQVIALFSIH